MAYQESPPSSEQLTAQFLERSRDVFVTLRRMYTEACEESAVESRRASMALFFMYGKFTLEHIADVQNLDSVPLSDNVLEAEKEYAEKYRGWALAKHAYDLYRHQQEDALNTMLDSRQIQVRKQASHAYRSEGDVIILGDTKDRTRVYCAEFDRYDPHTSRIHIGIRGRGDVWAGEIWNEPLPGSDEISPAVELRIIDHDA